MQPSQPLFRFGVFELDARDATLRKSGVRIHLQAQPLQALLVLLETPGHLVSRDDLRQRVWGTETVVDFERGLNYCIKQIREALDDDARSPRFVETVRGHGYRFLAAVERVEPTDGKPRVPASTKQAFPQTADPRSKHARPRALGNVGLWILMAAIVVLASTLFFVRSKQFANPSIANTTNRTKLAVLPFLVPQGDWIEPYLADGLVDELIHALGALDPERLGVIARTSSMRYRNESHSVDAIGKELDVDFVLEGSLRTDGERIRLTTQLVEVQEQTQVWNASYEVSVADLSALESTVSQGVVSRLATILLDAPPAESEVVAARSTGYDAYLRGRYEANKHTPAGLRASLDWFERARENDPELAVAYVGEAVARCRLALSGAPSQQETFRRAQQLCDRALTIDPQLAEAYAARAITILYHDLDWSASREAFEKSLALHPGLAQTHHWYAMLHAGQGDHPAAIAAVERARALDPVSPHVNADVGWYFYFAHRYEEAIEQSQRTLQLEPQFLSAAQCIVLSSIAKGDFDGAVRFLETTMREAGFGEEMLRPLRRDFDSSGIEGYWLWMATQTQHQQARGAPVNPFAFAMAYANLGRKDEAIQWLETAYEERALWLPFVAVEPMLEPLHTDPRFQQLVQRIGITGPRVGAHPSETAP